MDPLQRTLATTATSRWRDDKTKKQTEWEMENEAALHELARSRARLASQPKIAEYPRYDSGYGEAELEANARDNARAEAYRKNKDFVLAGSDKPKLSDSLPDGFVYVPEKPVAQQGKKSFFQRFGKQTGGSGTAQNAALLAIIIACAVMG